MLPSHRRVTTVALILATFATMAVLANTASAQRQVPVVVENDTSNPIPVSFVPAGGPGGGNLQYVLCMDNIKGAGVGKSFPGCMEVRSLGFGVGRVMQESGEKSGTADINIGVGRLESVLVQKPVDGASALLWAFGINGNSNGGAEIHVLEQREGWSAPLTLLEVRLDRTFVQSMTTDPGTFLENVALYFNQIQLTTYSRNESGVVILQSERCWDVVTQTASCSL